MCNSGGAKQNCVSVSRHAVVFSKQKLCRKLCRAAASEFVRLCAKNIMFLCLFTYCFDSLVFSVDLFVVLITLFLFVVLIILICQRDA